MVDKPIQRSADLDCMTAPATSCFRYDREWQTGFLHDLDKVRPIREDLPPWHIEAPSWAKHVDDIFIIKQLDQQQRLADDLDAVRMFP